ncbi:MAG TPA: AMP-binding protein [bacterium]|nr:AMP-binding protein [bacterium]
MVVSSSPLLGRRIHIAGSAAKTDDRHTVCYTHELIKAVVERLVAAASRVAHWLVGSGITAGTRAAVLMRNGASFVATTHALTKLGAVMVPLHARLTKPDLVRQLDGVGAPAVICDGARPGGGSANRACARCGGARARTT